MHFNRTNGGWPSDKTFVSLTGRKVLKLFQVTFNGVNPVGKENIYLRLSRRSSIAGGSEPEECETS